MGRGAEAFGHYAIAIDLNPQSFAAQFNFSLLLYETQEWKGAEASLRRTLELAPENLGIHQILGKLLFDRQRPGEAFGAMSVLLSWTAQIRNMHSMPEHACTCWASWSKPAGCLNALWS